MTISATDNRELTITQADRVPRPDIGCQIKERFDGVSKDIVVLYRSELRAVAAELLRIADEVGA